MPTTSLRKSENVPIVYILLASIFGLFFGYDFGHTLVKAEYFIRLFIIDGDALTKIIGSYLLGILLGIFLGGYVIYSSGRKICLVTSTGIGAIAILSSQLAPNISIFLLAQFVKGFAVAIYIMSCSLYICELSIALNRGLSLSLPWLTAALAATLAIVTEPFMTAMGLGAYFLIAALNIFFLVIAALYLIESPRWLALVGYHDAALTSLFKLRKNMAQAARELAIINDSCQGDSNGIELFFQNANFRRSLWLLGVITIFFYGAGFIFIPQTVLHFVASGNILYDIENERHFIYMLNRNTIVTVFIAAILVSFSVDRFARQQLMYFSVIVMLAILIILLVISILDALYISSNVLQILVLIFVLASVVFFLIIMPLLTLELIPLRGREFGFALIFFMHIACILFMLNSQTQILSALNLSGYFFASSFSCIILLYTVLHYIPNLQGIEIETIESRIQAGINLKDLSKND